jgi:hypothetical protein
VGSPDYNARKRHERHRRDLASVDRGVIRDRLDELGWPEVLNLSKIRYTLGTQGVRTSRVPIVMKWFGYERLPNPQSQSGTFGKYASKHEWINQTLYRKSDTCQGGA